MAKLIVRDLMTQDPAALGPDAGLHEARDLMDQHDIRHVPVVDDDGNVIGLVSQRDLLRSALVPTNDLPLSTQQDVLEAVKVGDIMTREVEVVGPDQDASLAGRLMLDNKYGCLPVVEDNHLAGILTESDFVRHVAGLS